MRNDEARVYSRAGLLGNPSDQYEGQAIAFALSNFSAAVRIEASDRLELVPGPTDNLVLPSFGDLVDSVGRVGCNDGLRLIRAAIGRFSLEWTGWRELGQGDPRLRFRISYQTDIPRQAGLAGSSAIIIATFRALSLWFGASIPDFRMAEMALAAEKLDLGIAAGPMDRGIQTFGGVLHMNFARPVTPRSYVRLDPSALPPLFVAWDPSPGLESGRIHEDVRRRWERGDKDVRRLIMRFPRLVESGLPLLETRDWPGFQALMNENFDLRAALWNIGKRDRRMIEIGRSGGAGVKLCGSGGAIVGAMRSEEEFSSFESAYSQAGFGIIRPRIAQPESPTKRRRST